MLQRREPATGGRRLAMLSKQNLEPIFPSAIDGWEEHCGRGRATCIHISVCWVPRSGRATFSLYLSLWSSTSWKVRLKEESTMYHRDSKSKFGAPPEPTNATRQRRTVTPPLRASTTIAHDGCACARMLHHIQQCRFIHTHDVYMHIL